MPGQCLQVTAAVTSRQTVKGQMDPRIKLGNEVSKRHRETETSEFWRVYFDVPNFWFCGSERTEPRFCHSSYMAAKGRREPAAELPGTFCVGAAARRFQFRSRAPWE